MPALKFRQVLRQLFGRQPRLRGRRGEWRSPVSQCAEVLEARALLSAGAIDGTFGNGGATAPGAGFASGMQSDGKSVTAGDIAFTFQVQVSKHGTHTYMGSEFSVSRYTTTGVLDTTFGGGKGTATVSLGSHAAVVGINAVRVQSDGKIVVSANAAPDVTVTSTSGEVVVVRLNSNGALDTTFAKNGVFTFATTNWVSDTAIDPQGRIILFDPASNNQFIRLNANGSLDNSFGTGGFMTSILSALGGAGGSILLQATPADPNGYEIVLGTTGTITVPKVQFAGELARFHSDGSLDTSFGTGGKTLFQVPLTPSQVVDGDVYSGTQVNKIALEADGSIVAVGNIDAYYQVARYVHLPVVSHFSASGFVDTAFGNNGYAVPVFTPGEFHNGTFSDVKLDAGGNIVAVGWDTNASGYQGVLARYTAAGQLDSKFGGGRGYVYFGPVESSGAFYIQFSRPNVCIDPYGNIIVDADNIGGQTLYGFMGS